MFLATTACEEFWDKETKILFLGEWCKLYERSNECSMLHSETFGFVWEDEKKKQAAYHYCNETILEAIEEITWKLNDIHGMKKDSRYYFTILNGWLNHYIPQLYDKYTCIIEAFEQVEGLDTWLLTEEDYYVPVTTRDFMVKLFLLDDRYALQQYSAIMSFLGMRFEKRKLLDKILQVQSYLLNDQKSIIHRYIFLLFSMINRMLYDNGQACVTLTDTYMSKLNIIKILLMSRFRFILDDMSYRVVINCKIDRQLRQRTKVFTESPDPFKRLLGSTIFKDIPIIYLERFKDFRNQVTNLPIRKTRVYFTSNAIYFNEIFKLHTAENLEDVKLVEHQHGGGYGLYLMMSREDIEYKFMDYFMTFGWQENEKHVPSYFFNIRHKKHKIRTKKVLFIRNGYSRYLVRFTSEPSSTENLKYIEDSIVFLKTLRNKIRVDIRLYQQEYGWYDRNRLLDELGECYFEDRKKMDILKSMGSSYIVVCDYLGTSILEAMIMNVPLIVFYDPCIVKFRHSALDLIEDLKHLKVLHESPLSAANHLLDIYENVDSWWFNKEVQEARNRFVYRYARYDKQWIGKLVETLKDIGQSLAATSQ